MSIAIAHRTSLRVGTSRVAQFSNLRSDGRPGSHSSGHCSCLEKHIVAFSADKSLKFIPYGSVEENVDDAGKA